MRRNERGMLSEVKIKRRDSQKSDIHPTE